jgi:SAM-dependent methyltransferase
MQSGQINRTLRSDFPRAALRWMQRRWQHLTRWPPLGAVRFGNLRRITPISGQFGLDRGKAIDRYYIETFLSRYIDDIRGRVLEIGDDRYTQKFGAGRVTRSDVLHLQPGNSKATLVGDLADAGHISADSFDSIILTQTLQFIYDVRAAVNHLHRILKPGGRLLATLPGISQISRYDMDRWGDFWRFTSLSARRLFEEHFSAGDVTVHAYGNVLAAIAFLEGLALEELKPEELDHSDRDYELLIAVRAVKAGRTS